ncbi:hypothetical protein N9L92_05505, partial [Saprospiraceae bacterium]|nr:hypothetical protein [Saprospiraceae bacterium]
MKSIKAILQFLQRRETVSSNAKAYGKSKVTDIFSVFNVLVVFLFSNFRFTESKLKINSSRLLGARIKSSYILLLMLFVQANVQAHGDDNKIELNDIQITTAQKLIKNQLAISIAANGDSDEVRVLDLRGTACYPQPDQLVSCGSPDTLSILIYTKSVDPIGPIDVNLEFGEGLRYGGFANIGTPDGNMMSSLDVISTTNLESPIFRLSEVSQASGGIVLEIAVQALCGVDFAANPPSIDLNLFYADCADNHELGPLSAAPLTPEVVFTGAPPSVTITDVETNFCLAQDFTQVTLDAAAGEVTVTISDYGFPEITLDEVMLGGVVVDPAFVTMDPVTGFTEVVLDGNAISSYFGGDGLLDQGEVETIEFCFQIQECPSAEIELPITPTMTILTTCNGEVCGAGQDIEDMATINISPNFRANPVASFETIQLPEVCSPIDGSAKEYIFDIGMTSSLTDPLRGRFDNLRFLVDECAGGALSLDRIEMFTGGTAAGALLPVDLGAASFSINDDGRLTISFRGAITDPDGPGGLDDLDGDLAFDDLEGGESVRFRVYMSVASCASECIPNDDDQPDSCQFFRVITQGIKDCSRAFSTAHNIDPVDPALVSASFAFYDELDDLNNNGSIQGYDFGMVGTGSGGPITGTIESQFKYNISGEDFNQCPAPGGTPKLRVVYIGDEPTAANIWLDNATLDGAPIAAGDITVTNTPGAAVFYIDAGDVSAGEHVFDFDMNIDTSYCGTPATYIMNTQLVEECPTCQCSPFIRACQVVLVRVDPNDFPNCVCDYDAIASSERINYGYTDRTQTTPLTRADFPGDDHPELDHVLPGDYLELKGQYILHNAGPANGRSERVSFALTTFQGNANVPNLVGRLNVDASSLQSFQVKRGTTVFDAVDIPVTGSLGGTYDGITLNGTRSAADFSRNDNTIQP